MLKFTPRLEINCLEFEHAQLGLESVVPRCHQQALLADNIAPRRGNGTPADRVRDMRRDKR